MIVSDLEDMFCPLIDGFLVSPIESRYVMSKTVLTLDHKSRSC